ncbi:MAG: ABC transporter permease subunit [Oscillospiraceae bacterium]|nr:ABC transporter permease subunit [Oscillospiraceae bacterium]
MVKASIPPGNELLERERGGQKQGVLITAASSLLMLIMTLPFIPWIAVVNTGTLYAHMGLESEVIAELDGGYSVLTILSFVQETRWGILGFFAALLLLAALGAAFMHLVTVIRAATRKYGQKGLLSFYGMAQAAMILSFLASAATIVYMFYSNHHFGMTGFVATPIPYITLLLSVGTYIIIKKMEKRERALEKDHGFLEELRRNWILFVFLLPVITYFLINNYLPMVGIYFAFTQFNFRDGLFASPFVGGRNFEFFFLMDLGRLVRNTVLYNVVFIGLGNILQIVFAIMVSRVGNKYFKKTSQTLIFMPFFVSFVILSVMVYNILNYEIGIVNTIVTSMGMDRIDFYNTPHYWPFLITFFFVWKNLGYGMVIYLATIMSISEEYYEAAQIDGANVFQQIIYITLPHLKPTFIILLLFALGGIMRGQFELFYQIIGHNGRLFNVADIFDTYVYRITTTQPLSMGLGAAAGLFQSIFGFIIIMTTNFFIKRSNEEYALF